MHLGHIFAGRTLLRPPGKRTECKHWAFSSGFSTCLPICMQGEDAQLFADAVGWGNETALVNVSAV